MFGIREDLSNVIYNISPVETPFVNMIPHVKATQMTHEWQTDSLLAAANNAVIEGDDVAASASNPTTRLGNITQLSHKAARVTSRARAVNTAGRSDELIYQMELKRARELRRDIELCLLSNKIKNAGSDVLAPQAAGIISWIKTNEDVGASGVAPVTADGAATRTDGTLRAFTETQLKSVLVKIYNAGGYPDVLMLGPSQRQTASSFTTGRTVMQKAEDNTLHATFSIYEGDFGPLKIIPNRFQRARDGLVLQTDMWAFATLQDFHSYDLAKTGHSDARVVAVEYTLEARNEAASGIVADLL
jgi:hypothetical protein